jgi:hypothetical protein
MTTENKNDEVSDDLEVDAEDAEGVKGGFKVASKHESANGRVQPGFVRNF